MFKTIKAYVRASYLLAIHRDSSKQLRADLSGLVRDYDTFKHVTDLPVVVSDKYCSGFACAYGNSSTGDRYIVMSQAMYSMYKMGTDIDKVDAVVCHETGHHRLGHLDHSLLDLAVCALDSDRSMQREYEADEYAHVRGYPIIEALIDIRSFYYTHCEWGVIDVLTQRIQRLESLPSPKF